MKRCDPEQGPIVAGSYCVECDAVMASQDASRWWCTEVCFEEWQAWRWQRPDTRCYAVAAEEAKPL
jgi:hypothetical protein